MRTRAQKNSGHCGCPECDRLRSDITDLAYIVSAFLRLGCDVDAAQTANMCATSARGLAKHIAADHVGVKSAA